MAEWLKAAVLKTVKGESSSRVRIPLPPREKTNAYCVGFSYGFNTTLIQPSSLSLNIL